MFPETMLEIKIISLAKFREGGAARFRARKINHQKVRLGKMVDMPFVRKIFRDWVSE